MPFIHTCFQTFWAATCGRSVRFLMLNWRDPRNPLAGGAERVTEAYLRALLARGHEVAWFANAFEGAAKEEDLDGLRVVRGGGKCL